VKAVRFTEAEKVAALLRVKENHSGTQNARVKKAQVIEPLQDIRVWLVALSVILTSTANGGLGSFSNILLTTFDYTPQQSVRGQKTLCVSHF
jgi:MFS transporter, ACS family, allantoate permease